EAGCLISCDPNWRPHLWSDPSEAPALIRQTLAECDVVKISDDEIVPLFGTTDSEAAAHAMRELGVQVAIVSLGARGCFYEAPGGRGYVAGEKVEVVDTTGAGDGFMAGLWAALLPQLAGNKSFSGAELEVALRYANRVGALTCTKFGATTALPRKHEVQ